MHGSTMMHITMGDMNKQRFQYLLFPSNNKSPPTLIQNVQRLTTLSLPKRKNCLSSRTETKPHYQRSDRQDKSKLTHKA